MWSIQHSAEVDGDQVLGAPRPPSIG